MCPSHRLHAVYETYKYRTESYMQEVLRDMNQARTKAEKEAISKRASLHQVPVRFVPFRGFRVYEAFCPVSRVETGLACERSWVSKQPMVWITALLLLS
jgi:hypothetical protein